MERVKEAIRKAELIKPNAAPASVSGTITNVEDPKQLGRAKLTLATFTSDDGTVAYETNWCYPLNFRITNGILPKDWVNTPVVAFPINGDYAYVTFVSHKTLVYKEVTIPKPCIENLGLSLLHLNNNESLHKICLLRNGIYVWEPISPLYHIHLKGDIINQGNDFGGDIQQPISPGITHDKVAATTVTHYVDNSKNIPPLLT